MESEPPATPNRRDGQASGDSTVQPKSSGCGSVTERIASRLDLQPPRTYDAFHRNGWNDVQEEPR